MTPKTKEEIIAGRILSYLTTFSAMDEYAEQMSIGFGKYLGEWGWELCPAGHSQEGEWVSPINIQYGFKTIAELFTLYKQSL